MVPEIAIPDLNSKKHSPIELQVADCTSFDGKNEGFVQNRR